MNDTKWSMSSLDHLANNIASATFDVINAAKVRTADMGGKCPSYPLSQSARAHAGCVMFRFCDDFGVHCCGY